MSTSETIQTILSRAYTQSIVAMRIRLTQDDNQQTFSATYLGANKVQLANGDIRPAQNQGTKEVAIGESVTVIFPLHSGIGFYTSKIF
jgi:hypothetical protein